MPHAEVDGQRLHDTDSGGDGEVTVFSHGFFMSHAMFAPQVEALRDRSRCVAWDERGHGATATTPEPVTSWDSTAARALADALPAGELVVVPGAGHATNLTHPAQVNPAIEAFLARLPETA